MTDLNVSRRFHLRFCTLVAPATASTISRPVKPRTNRRPRRPLHHAIIAVAPPRSFSSLRRRLHYRPRRRPRRAFRPTCRPSSCSVFDTWSNTASEPLAFFACPRLESASVNCAKSSTAAAKSSLTRTLPFTTWPPYSRSSSETCRSRSFPKSCFKRSSQSTVMKALTQKSL